MQTFFFIFLTLTKLHLSQNVDVYSTQNLTTYLMREYDKSSKPGGQVNISMQISISQLVGLQEKEQTITLNVWVTQIWNDTRLMYNLSQFPDLYTSIPSDKLWV